jgi:hypothetical protein
LFLISAYFHFDTVFGLVTKSIWITTSVIYFLWWETTHLLVGKTSVFIEGIFRN